jgi:hypothetical protein
VFVFARHSGWSIKKGWAVLCHLEEKGRRWRRATPDVQAEHHPGIAAARGAVECEPEELKKVIAEVARAAYPRQWPVDTPLKRLVADIEC